MKLTTLTIGLVLALGFVVQSAVGFAFASPDQLQYWYHFYPLNIFALGFHATESVLLFFIGILVLTFLRAKGTNISWLKPFSIGAILLVLQTAVQWGSTSLGEYIFLNKLRYVSENCEPISKDLYCVLLRSETGFDPMNGQQEKLLIVKLGAEARASDVIHGYTNDQSFLLGNRVMEIGSERYFILLTNNI